MDMTYMDRPINFDDPLYNLRHIHNLLNLDDSFHRHLKATTLGAQINTCTRSVERHHNFWRMRIARNRTTHTYPHQLMHHIYLSGKREVRPVVRPSRAGWTRLT
jgi:hypothetical protein